MGQAQPEAPDPLAFANPAAQDWFARSFAAPTEAQALGWPPIVEGQSTLLLAPTGSGKTLAAFLTAIDRLMFSPEPDEKRRCRVLYVSPLKALGVDVERNLRAPLAGIAAVAERMGIPHRVPQVAIRSGDTPAKERARQQRHPPDVLITTPESLYLLLTSNAREYLRSVETVIVDEIHSVVSTKRGSHLFVSLERLAAGRTDAQGQPVQTPLQRIGLSATQRPLHEIARALGGADVDAEGKLSPRPVTIVDAGRTKKFDIVVEVPVEDMAKLPAQPAPTPGNPDDDILAGPAAAQPSRPSIWPSIHPRLVELIRAHRSTMIFTNSRRLSERLAGALNEHAGEQLARAHHGSIAKETRAEIEDQLKRGQLPAIVATSTLELGIDMGAVDLVIQIESPPSVASGIQRIGRAGHHVGAESRGIVFPKFRGDLLACAAVTERMRAGQVEESFYPRNPLDVLAQQIVAMASVEKVEVETLYRRLRQAAPFAELPRKSFEGVLDLLAGRYPSDEFAELRPRITWDRIAGTVEARRGAKRTAIVNAGTIPDRGNYGVFLAGDEGRSVRVGELDEEMVFESSPGDVFLLGASSWRIVEITHDRVLVIPAPGEPGRMPFWRGDGLGRTVELGRAVGKLTRELSRSGADEAVFRLCERHGLEPQAATNLLAYVKDQIEATGEVPSDKTIVVERFVDEIGDWRVVVLTPFGVRVHAPWSMAVNARLRDQLGLEVDTLWTDDGIAFRLPESDRPPDLDAFFPRGDEIEDLVVNELRGTSMFALRFRENAARALLLPRRMPGRRTPLWVQRRRAADLLGVAARYPEFPIILETYRECLRDVFDLGGLAGLLRDVESRKIRVRAADTKSASPFASAVLFTWVGTFLYDDDMPLAERRAAALSLDHAQLRELLGDAELRELLDGDAIDEIELRLQRLDQNNRIRHVDALHDALLGMGDLALDEIEARTEEAAPITAWLDELLHVRRVVKVQIGGDERYAAAEDAGRLRDALGVVPPPGLPEAFLEPVRHPLEDLVSRYARTHGPFRAEAVAARLGIGIAAVLAALQSLALADRVVEGEFLPGGQGREWCDVEVLRGLKRRSLAKLRKQVEPVDQAALGRFLPQWQGLIRPRRGLDGLLETIEQLQGAALPASVLESEVLSRRVYDYGPADLDELCAAGEVVWAGADSIGMHDGRIALYLTDSFSRLARSVMPVEGELAARLRTLLAERGASFHADLLAEIGGFPQDLLDTLWDMVWAGELSNDTLAPVRSRLRASQARSKGRRPGRVHGRYRSRRSGPPGTEGRWYLLERDASVTATERQTALATQLLERYGVLTREAVAAEGLVGGFGGVYPVLKAMEETGRVRRGYFIEGLGATQFALPGADDRLRAGSSQDDVGCLVLAATDPANPYGSALPWPRADEEETTSGPRPQRAAGAFVFLHEGELVGFTGRTGQTLASFLPAAEPRRSKVLNDLAQALAGLATARQPVVLSTIDGAPPSESALAPFLVEAGFEPSAKGLIRR